MRDFSIRPARRKSVYQGKELADLSLMRDGVFGKIRVLAKSRNPCEYFKVNSGYTSACGFYIFIRIQACSVACHLEASISLALN